jgi:hypothetical protein
MTYEKIPQFPDQGIATSIDNALQIVAGLSGFAAVVAEIERHLLSLVDIREQAGTQLNVDDLGYTNGELNQLPPPITGNGPN